MAVFRIVSRVLILLSKWLTHSCFFFSAILTSKPENLTTLDYLSVDLSLDFDLGFKGL
jgi:hypothetical protein